MIALPLCLQFLVPSPNAQIVILAPLAIGLITAFNLGPRSNVATGLFLVFVYASTLFGKMYLGSFMTVMTRGIIEEQTGLQVLWSQWAIAFLPISLLTLVACWAIARCLYPPEVTELPGGQTYLREVLAAMGPWSREESKALFWLVMAIVLWATDFWHHIHPAFIGIGIGLLLTLPNVGVLDTQAVKSVNFFLVLLVGGALSMANVLRETQALTLLTEGLIDVMTPFLSHPVTAALTLYWGGFVYHLFMPGEGVMISTALPVLINVTTLHDYNPIAVGLLWTFASGSMVFVYQSAALVLGFSYNYFRPKDLLKMGIFITLSQSLFLMILPFYWPLIGMSWELPPSSAHQLETHSKPQISSNSISNNDQNIESGIILLTYDE